MQILAQVDMRVTKCVTDLYIIDVSLLPLKKLSSSGAKGVTNMLKIQKEKR